MNSILQQFFFIGSFRKEIVEFRLDKVPEMTLVNGVKIVDDFLYQLQRMYVYLEMSEKRSFNPRELCLTIKDRSMRPINTSIQEDAH